jgi:hypothetical protein
MIRKPQRLPDPTAAWIDPKTGRPTNAVYQYFRELDQAVRELIDRDAATAITLADFELRITDLETP